MRAALSLDLDNKWSYMKTHGDPGWRRFPSYLDIVVPRALAMLKRHGLRITFFIVGQDAGIPSNAAAIQEITGYDHEIGNHSFHHEPWLHRRPDSEIDDELARAEYAIEDVTGRQPQGFRGPGFVRSDATLRVLARRGYAYDASSLPTFIGPLARAYYFRSAKLDPEARKEREDLFGSFHDGFQPNRMHDLSVDGDLKLKEIPVTTMPGLRFPIHVSYVLYLATVSRAIAIKYFQTAMALCRLTRTEPSILLHPLDFIDERECPELAFFPAMNLCAIDKMEIVERVLDILKSSFEVMPLLEMAGRTRQPIAAHEPVAK